MPAGGYRAPSNPAAVVAGPGALSQRTDAGQPKRDLPDARYGENAEYQAQQAGAPLAVAAGPATLDVPSGPGPGQQAAPRPAPAEITPMFAPSARPGEPVTAGSPLGAGPGPQLGAYAAEPGSLSEAMAPWVASDPSGVLSNLTAYLMERGL